MSEPCRCGVCAECNWAEHHPDVDEEIDRIASLETQLRATEERECQLKAELCIQKRVAQTLASAPTQGEPTKEPPRFGHEIEHYNAYACKHCGLMTGYWPTLPECSVRFAQAYPLPEHLKEPTQGEGITEEKQ